MSPEHLRALTVVLGVASFLLGLAGLIATVVQGGDLLAAKAGGGWAGVAGGLAIFVTLRRRWGSDCDAGDPPHSHHAMRLAVLLALLAGTASAQPVSGRLSVSGAPVFHAVISGTDAVAVPAATAAVMYQAGGRDRVGVFALFSPERGGDRQASRLVALGATWEILLTQGPSGLYATVGAAGVRQSESTYPPCLDEEGCFREGGVDLSGFTSAAAVVGAGRRFDVGRGAFVQADARALVGTELVRPLLSVGGGIRL